jgi:hypothetical protein
MRPPRILYADDFRHDTPSAYHVRPCARAAPVNDLIFSASAGVTGL